MNISELTFKLLLLFLPGIISVLIIEDRTTHKKWESYRFVVYSFLNGLICYLVLQILYFILTLTHYLSKIFTEPPTQFLLKYLTIWSNLLKTGDIPFLEILLSCIVSVFLGLIATYLIESKFLYRNTTRFNISSKFGDESLFYNFLDSANVNFVYVHDKENNLTFHGYVNKYAEDDNNKELLLTNVSVYLYEDAKYLYDVESVYISKSISSSIHIEIPNIKKDENGEEK